jgi:hypothetical protein
MSLQAKLPDISVGDWIGLRVVDHGMRLCG